MAKAAPFFTNSSMWNLQWSVIYIHASSYLYTNTYTLHVENTFLKIFFMKIGKRKNLLCKGLTWLWLTCCQSGCKWLKDLLFYNKWIGLHTQQPEKKKYKKELRNITIIFLNQVKRLHPVLYFFQLKKTLHREKALRIYSAKQNCQQPSLSQVS